MPKLYFGKRGGMYYRKGGRKVYVKRRMSHFGNDENKKKYNSFSIEIIEAVEKGNLAETLEGIKKEISNDANADAKAFSLYFHKKMDKDDEMKKIIEKNDGFWTVYENYFDRFKKQKKKKKKKPKPDGTGGTMRRRSTNVVKVDEDVLNHVWDLLQKQQNYHKGKKVGDDGYDPNYDPFDQFVDSMPAAERAVIMNWIAKKQQKERQSSSKRESIEVGKLGNKGLNLTGGNVDVYKKMLKNKVPKIAVITQIMRDNADIGMKLDEAEELFNKLGLSDEEDSSTTKSGKIPKDQAIEALMATFNMKKGDAIQLLEEMGYESSFGSIEERFYNGMAFGCYPFN